MKYWVGFLAAFAMLAATGCGTAKIVDVSASRATRSYKRIAVLVHGQQDDTLRIAREGSEDWLSTTLVEGLQSELRARGVEVAAWLVDPLELNPDSIAAAVEQFQPDAMLISRPRSAVMENWKIAELYYTVIFTDIQSGKAVWKAISLKEFNATMPEMAGRIADSLAQYGYVPAKRGAK